ncbi:MAG: hypothetical protein ACOCNL_08570 [Acetivibrio ethanolgignens]
MKNKERTVTWCDKEKLNCLCNNCLENKQLNTNGKCDGCKDCGKNPNKPCLII